VLGKLYELDIAPAVVTVVVVVGVRVSSGASNERCILILLGSN